MSASYIKTEQKTKDVCIFNYFAKGCNRIYTSYLDIFWEFKYLQTI